MQKDDERFIPLDQEDLELIGEKKKAVKRLKRKGAVESEPEPEPDAEPEDDDERDDRDEDGGGNEDEDDLDDQEGGEGDGERAQRGGAAGAPRRRPKSSAPREELGRDEEDDGFVVGAKRSRSSASQSGFSSENRVTDHQLAEWQAIFGDDRGGEEPFVPDGDYVPEEGEDAADPQRRAAAAMPVAGAGDAAGQVKSLDKLFDPSLLSGKFLTKRDLEIKAEDIPERVQLRIPNRPPPEEGELDVEANWCLAKYLKKNPLSESEQTEILHKIFYMLHFIRTEMNEVPFVYQYRVDDLHPLTEDDCWDVLDWDEEWHRLTVRKRQLMNLFGDVQEMVRLGAEERYVQAIATAESEEDLADLTAYFYLNFAQKAQQHVPENRRAALENIVTASMKNGVFDVATKFAISASQLGENMWNDQLIHFPSEIPVMPEEAVAELAEKLNVRPEVALAHCRKLLAQQVADDL